MKATRMDLVYQLTKEQLADIINENHARFVTLQNVIEKLLEKQHPELYKDILIMFMEEDLKREKLKIN